MMDCINKNNKKQLIISLLQRWFLFVKVTVFVSFFFGGGKNGSSFTSLTDWQIWNHLYEGINLIIYGMCPPQTKGPTCKYVLLEQSTGNTNITQVKKHIETKIEMLKTKKEIIIHSYA